MVGGRETEIKANYVQLELEFGSYFKENSFAVDYSSFLDINYFKKATIISKQVC